MRSLDTLKQGREAFLRRAWGEAYRALSTADQSAPLGAEDLELAATAAYLAGREPDYHRCLERAHHAHRQCDAPERAARCAFWLGLTLMFRGEAGQGSGWLARARRLVEGRDCVEHGYLLLPASEGQLIGGNAQAAHDTATEAVQLGERFADRDLIACARHLQGRSLLRQGKLAPGLALLDEAMLAVVGGELSPIVTGLVYCSVIAACQQVLALGRAREWTLALARWCDGQPELVAFAGTCLVHRAEILQFHGAWEDALAEARRACERFSRGVEATPPGAALYRQAEVHRLRGRFEAAETAYREAARHGCEPQPGLALLRSAQGRHDAACAAIRRVLAAADDSSRRAAFLPAAVEILLAAGDRVEASGACRQLEAIARELDADALQAMAAHARGAVALAEGECAAAAACLRRAFDLWRQLEAPYEAARARMLTGLACRALGDEEAAEVELAAARAAFEQLGAAPELRQLGVTAKRSMHGLTPRELQVLRLVAAGRTNKAIARELHLSERTVDRHVASLLAKLDVPSRAAATAYAYHHRLL